MKMWTPISIITGILCLASTHVEAASLQAAPTSFELFAPKSTTTLTLHNNGTTVLNAQVRTYRWSQVDGTEHTDPTTDLVASPPAVSIPPGGDQIVRIVRVAKTPVQGEESFRIIADELPDNSQPQKNGSINFVFKYSLPMFIEGAEGTKSSITWSLENRGGKTMLLAQNSGSRRSRIAGLTITAPSGKKFVYGQGLNGYVLAGSRMGWVVPSGIVHGVNGAVHVTAESDEGPINAQAQATLGGPR